MTTLARSRHAGLVAVVSAVATLAVVGPSEVRAQDQAALAKVQELNKKALDSYDNLEPDEARKLLMQALEVCASAGIGSHPLKARTHLNLGVVLMGGFKQRDHAVKQFRRAIEIQPDIKLSKSVATPETQSAFDEAKAGAGSGAPEKPEPVAAPAPAPAPSEPPRVVAAPDVPPTNIKGIHHRPVTESRPGEPITIKAAINANLNFKRIIVAYRPEGLSDYLQREMRKDEKGWFVAKIPEVATRGGLVSYYIEAREAGDKPVVANGSAAEPHVVSIVGGTDAPAAVVEQADDPGEARDSSGAPSLWFGMGVGVGWGYAKGSPEVNQLSDGRQFSGTAPANLLHLTPELAYVYAPNLVFALQGRFQIVTGGTSVYDMGCAESRDAQGIGTCSPAKGALAVLGKVTKLFGHGAFKPFVSGLLGVGEMRHLVVIDRNLPGCGGSAEQVGQCKDTVLSGPVFAGGGAGVQYALSENTALIATTQLLFGVPKMTANIDLNAAVAFGF